MGILVSGILLSFPFTIMRVSVLVFSCRKVISRLLTLSMRNRHYNLILILLICEVGKYEAQGSSGFFPESHSFL